MTHKPNGTQQQRILKVLENLRDGTLDVAEEYIRRHPTGDGVSARYLKQVMLVSECNGRISELRGNGFDIETSKEKDPYGFVFHRLKPVQSQTTASMTMEEYWNSLPANSINV